MITFTEITKTDTILLSFLPCSGPKAKRARHCDSGYQCEEIKFDDYDYYDDIKGLAENLNGMITAIKDYGHEIRDIKFIVHDLKEMPQSLANGCSEEGCTFGIKIITCDKNYEED